MGNWSIKSSKVTKGYGLQTDALIVAGKFSLDEQSGEVLAVNGTCYRPAPNGDKGEMVGTFNGQRIDGKLEYSYSRMSKNDNMAVLDAITEIEEHIKNND